MLNGRNKNNGRETSLANLEDAFPAYYTDLIVCGIISKQLDDLASDKDNYYTTVSILDECTRP